MPRNQQDLRRVVDGYPVFGGTYNGMNFDQRVAIGSLGPGTGDSYAGSEPPSDLSDVTASYGQGTPGLTYETGNDGTIYTVVNGQVTGWIDPNQQWHAAQAPVTTPTPTPSPTPTPYEFPQDQIPSATITGGGGTLPPEVNPFGQYTPPTSVTLPGEQFPGWVQPNLEQWDYQPDFSNSFNTPQSYQYDLTGNAPSSQFLNLGDYVSTGAPSAGSGAIPNFGGGAIDWGQQLPSVPDYAAYTPTPTMSPLELYGYNPVDYGGPSVGGNAIPSFGGGMPNWGNIQSYVQPSQGGSILGNQPMDWGSELPSSSQYGWSPVDYGSTGGASQGGNLSLGGYGEPTWVGDHYDPSIYQGNDISSFGGLNDPNSFDISGGWTPASSGYVPQPGTNTYDFGNGQIGMYDSDWNWLGMQSTPQGQIDPADVPQTADSGYFGTPPPLPAPPPMPSNTYADGTPIFDPSAYSSPAAAGQAFQQLSNISPTANWAGGLAGLHSSPLSPAGASANPTSHVNLGFTSSGLGSGFSWSWNPTSSNAGYGDTGAGMGMMQHIPLDTAAYYAHNPQSVLTGIQMVRDPGAGGYGIGLAGSNARSPSAL